ncbi:MAG: hypothetical protein R6U85_06080, partial [Salinivirgaceae bacterium]
MKHTEHTNRNHKQRRENTQSDNENAQISATKEPERWQRILHAVLLPFSTVLKYTLLLVVNIYRY